MKLSNRKSKLEISILGYEFPNSMDKFDANWLRVGITADDDAMTWTAVDSCLRTFELVELLSWFESISSGASNVKDLNFTEQELGFGFTEEHELLVRLDFGFHPTGEKYDYDADKEVILRFKLAELNLSGVVDSLLKSIKQFPERKF